MKRLVDFRAQALSSRSLRVTAGYEQDKSHLIRYMVGHITHQCEDRFHV